VQRRDVDDLVNSLVGSPSRGTLGPGFDSGDLTPLSIPGTPAPPGISLPAIGSGRVSRQSDFSSERFSNPLSHSTSSATDHVIERYVISISLIYIYWKVSHYRSITPRLHVDLIDIEQELLSCHKRFPSSRLSIVPIHSAML
jgi:hypothetical protein